MPGRKKWTEWIGCGCKSTDGAEFNDSLARNNNVQVCLDPDSPETSDGRVSRRSYTHPGLSLSLCSLLTKSCTPMLLVVVVANHGTASLRRSRSGTGRCNNKHRHLLYLSSSSIRATLDRRLRCARIDWCAKRSNMDQSKLDPCDVIEP